MPTQKKIQIVADLRKRLERATIAVSTEYRGLRVQEMEQIRRRLRAAGVELRVVKNTLLRLAAQEAGRPKLVQIVEGPTALALGYDDVVEAAKAIVEAAQSAPPAFALRSAFLDGQIVSQEELRELVKLPPRPVMIAQVLGHLQSPLAGLVGLLEGPLQELSLLLQSALSELPGLLEARARQLEGAS